MKLGKKGLLDKDDKKASQGYVDLKSMTIEQLDELIERQHKLLQNRSFLEKLPDKGNRILSFKTKLEIERKKKQEELDEACQLMSNLNLNEKNAEDIEWNQGKLNGCETQLDSDDEEDEEEKESREDKINPLKLLASHSGTANGKNINVQNPKSEICNKDTKIYVDKCCEKYGKLNNSKERFKPNQLRNNDKTLFVTSAEQIKKRLGNKWEVTQATPPVPVYNNVMMISLSESLKLQKEQAKKLKEIEQKHATEKLIQNMSMKINIKLPINNTTEYRTIKSPFQEIVEDDDNESNDSESEDNKNTEIFPLDDGD